MAALLLVAVAATVAVDGGSATTTASDSDDAFRTGFHFQPPPSARHSVMNDPNGIFRDAKTGLFHMFAQFRFTNASFTEAHPSGVGWLHAVSANGLAWRHLPMALEPQQPWECGGIFTGSATVPEPGGIVLAFAVECNEAIGVALPSNASDPLLTDWRTPTRVVSHTPSYNFRDPVTAFRPPPTAASNGTEAEWRMAVGCSGHLCTFRSADFQTWRDAGSFYHVPGQHMWECPDVFPLPGSDGLWVIKVSSAPFDEYVVGRLHTGANDSFVPVEGAADIGAKNAPFGAT